MNDCIDHGRVRSLAPDGYAHVGVPGVSSRSVGLHRLVYCKHHGLDLSYISGKVIRHTCDNPRCINPAHLLIGTRADNNRDRAERGRSARLVPSRQSLSDADVAYIRSVYVRGSREYGCPALGRKFGVDQAYVNRIVKGVQRP